MKLCKIIVVVILMKKLQCIFLIANRTPLQPDAITRGESLSHQEIDKLKVILELLSFFELLTFVRVLEI